MISSTEPKLLIDLTNVRQATALNAESILHRVQLEAFLNRVNEVVGRVDGFCAKLKKSDGRTRSVSYERYHDVITLHGKRGSGKTTFLLSALKLLQEGDVRKENFNKNGWKHLDRLCVLEILDPTLFGLHEHLLLSLMAKIAFEVRSAAKNGERNLCGGHDACCSLEKWEGHLRQFANALKRMGETRDDLEITLSKETVEWEDAQFIFEQNMENAQRSFGLEREFHNFLNESLKLLDKDAFVLALDDIDTRPQIGWHVLEVLRRYFTSPQLVVVLSGDMDLFKTIIEKQQLKIFDLNFASEAAVRKEFKARVDGLTEQYLLKILRTSARIHIGSFDLAVRQWGKQYPSVRHIVKINEDEHLLSDLVQNFYEVFACASFEYKKIFYQVFFSNPARTVTQILEALVSSYKQEVVERLREVFLVQLQNLGFENPFEFFEVLQSRSGVSELIKRLFPRGFISSGLDLLPTSKDQDINNGILALHAELAVGMSDNISLLFSYLFKACLLREVLLLQEDDVSGRNYARLEDYISLGKYEPLSQTVLRISALLWGNSRPNSYHKRGLIRLYGTYTTAKPLNAFRAMYGAPFEDLVKGKSANVPDALQKFRSVVVDSDLDSSKPIGAWTNTPETVNSYISSWQSMLSAVGIVGVSSNSSNYRFFSIFALLSVLGDVFESEGDSIQGAFAKYNNIHSFRIFDKPSVVTGVLRNNRPIVFPDEAAIIVDGVSKTPENDEKNCQMFFDAMNAWRENCQSTSGKICSPVVLSARIIERFFDALKSIDDAFPYELGYVGNYIHQVLVTFFNAVLIEESDASLSETSKSSISYNNPITSDSVFLNNFEKLFGKYEVGYNKRQCYPLFCMIFSCPLWGLYIKPEYSSDDDHKTVYDVYLAFVANSENVKQFSQVAFGSSNYNFDNLHYILNSLQIPKALPPNQTGRNDSKKVNEILTKDGIRANLTQKRNAFQYERVINDFISQKSGLCSDIMDYFKRMNDISSENFSEIVKLYYSDSELIGAFSVEKIRTEFVKRLRQKTK